MTPNDSFIESDNMAFMHPNFRRQGYHFVSILLLFLILPLWILCSATPLFGAQPSDHKKILLLASYHPSAPVGNLWSRGIRSILESEGHSNVDLDIEYLDVLRFRDARYAQLLTDLLRHKYATSQPDLVVAVYNTALDFMRTHGSELFPGVPVVFAGVEEKFIDIGKLGPNVTGLLSVPNYSETLDLALRLHPDTQHVAVVSGAGKIGRTWSMNAMQAFQPYGDRVDFIDLTGLPMPTILEKVANLPQRSLVMYITLLEDGGGNKFTATQSAFQISGTANAPVYSFWDVMLGHGIVGGYLSSAEEKGRAAAALALRILNGEQPSDIPPANEDSLKAKFDWRELRRWSIKEDLLPPESIIKFKRFSTWESYKSWIIGGFVLIVFQVLVIAYLLYQRWTRIQTEQTLADQLAFERLSAQLSSEFIRLPADQTESTILESLARVGALLAADRVFVFRFNWDKTRFVISHLWESNGAEPDQIIRGSVVKDFIPWVYINLINGQDIIVNDVEKLPDMKAIEEYEYCRQIGIRSFVIIPVQVADAPLCAIGLDAIQARRDWPTETIDHLRLIGEIFANAIERQHSYKRAKSTEWKFRTMADHTYDWEYWQAADGSMVYVSPACERISGYPPQDFMRSPELLVEIIVPEDRNIWVGHRCNIPRQSETESLLQYRIQHRDGDIRWIEHACQPVFGPQGRDLGVRGSNRDITQRQLLRSESEELQTELAHIDRVVTISAMTSALAHEINQPLAAMRSYAQAALRFLDADETDNANIRKALQGIVADNKRASAVVNRLRDLVKKKKTHKEKLDINRAIKDVLMLTNSEVVMRNTEIQTDLDPSVPAFYGDAVQLQQVVMNLLTNAMDAMNEVPVERRTIMITTRLEKTGHLVMSIADAGQGIAPHQLKDIFTPFHSTKAQGLGLGLAISKSIINSFGGSIKAENNPGGGATMALVLPVADPGI